MSPEAARIIAKNKALGLPAHGMPFQHRALCDIACQICGEPAFPTPCRHARAEPIDLIARRAEIKRIAEGRRG